MQSVHIRPRENCSLGQHNGTLIGNSTVHRKFIQNSDTGCWASLCNVCSVTLFLRVDRVQKERISRIPAKVCAQFII